MFKNRHGFLLAAGIVVLGSCSPEHELNQKNSAHFPGQDKPTALRLSYELETVTYQDVITPGENANFAFLDEIAGEPVANRQAIDVVIFQDGSADYLIEEREPQYVSLPSAFEGVPPSDQPPITKTKITGGMAYFYDENDNLLYEHPMEENYGMQEQMLHLTGQYHWKAEAQAAGAQIETLKNGMLLIRKPVPEETQTEPALRTAGRYTEDLVDATANLLIGSSLHEADGKLVCRMAYRYDYQEEENQWHPKMTQYEEYGTDEVTGSEYVNKTTYHYDNYSLQTN